jgi:flagellin-like hook-associated protein FlgL
MPIEPLRPGNYAATAQARQLSQSRATLDDLQRQISSGKRSETWGGLGAERIVAIDARARNAEIEGYRQSIASAQGRLALMDRVMTQLSGISEETRSAAVAPPFDPGPTGRTSQQTFARSRFEEVVSLLNTSVQGRALFAGRASERPPVLDAKSLLEGDGAGRAGVRQMIAERKAADLGGGSGRLLTGGAGAVASLEEEAAGLPFGFKLLGLQSNTAAVSAGAPSGSPATAGFTVTGAPLEGETVEVLLGLPDGSQERVSLTARTTLSPPGVAGAFAIGATPAATAANLRTALAATVALEASTSLMAASALTAATAFFNGTPSSPPQRVPAPAATAATLVTGTAADTVIWYQGDETSADARGTATVRADSDLTIRVGAEAREEGFRRLLSTLAAYATESFAPNTTDQGRHQDLVRRMRATLSEQPGAQQVKHIQGELGFAATTLKKVEDRHAQRLNLLATAIADVEDINTEETAAKLLAQQTKLQASYQTTAILSRLSLADYLR